MMTERAAREHERDERRWRAVLARDAAMDGEFWFAVATTGVYCRPSCPARRPRRENVGFYASRGKAEAAGFRPCRRCRPDEASREARIAALVVRACRTIERAGTAPRLAELAKAADLGPHHFHRVFRAATGVTPGAYAAARRAERLRAELGTNASVTGALHASFGGANGHVYDRSRGALGMSPTAFRKGGAGETITYATGASWLGAVLVAASEAGVCAILLDDDPRALAPKLADFFPHARLVEGDARFARTVEAVLALIEEPERGLDLPLDIRGAAFQQRVWRALRDIPLGETATYGGADRRAEGRARRGGGLREEQALGGGALSPRRRRGRRHDGLCGGRRAQTGAAQQGA
jgi:AraC family transcriptional regulator of adaptative response/methylated-DNA-[protein]-cysteine methyltransferase